jgi:hypothetical protein
MVGSRRSSRWIASLTALLATACGGATAAPARPSHARVDCVAPAALESVVDVDLDDDGAPDVVAREGRSLVLFVTRDGCASRVARVVDLTGPIAEVSVSGAARPMRDLVDDTWLHHGDRKRTRYEWRGGHYAPVESSLIARPAPPAR